jgi:hypothetical protein
VVAVISAKRRRACRPTAHAKEEHERYQYWFDLAGRILHGTEGRDAPGVYDELVTYQLCGADVPLPAPWFRTSELRGRVETDRRNGVARIYLWNVLSMPASRRSTRQADGRGWSTRSPDDGPSDRSDHYRSRGDDLAGLLGVAALPTRS